MLNSVNPYARSRWCSGDTILVVAPASSRALRGSVSSTCSKPSVTRMAALSPLRVSLAMIWLLSNPGVVSAGLRLQWRKLRLSRASCRGSSPALVDTGLRLFAAILCQRRIVCVSLLAAAVIRRRIVGVEGRADAQPLGQIGIGDELAAESDQVCLAFAKPLRRGVGLEAARHHQGSLEFLPDRLDHYERTGIRRFSALHLLQRRIDDMQIGKAIVAEALRDIAKGCFRLVVVDVVHLAHRRQPHADAVRPPDPDQGLGDLEQ